MGRPALAWALPRLFAHRCGGALAPENSLSGLRIAAALGVRAVEFDVMLSADGTPWLIHDETLERTTDGAGRVCEASDSALRSLDAGRYRHHAFAGESLPTFGQAARLCQELGLLVNVEIKPALGFERVTGERVALYVLELWRGSPLPLVSSFSETALRAARAAAPDLPLGYLCERPPADWPRRVDALGAFSLHCSADAIDDVVLRVSVAESVPVLCWTVNDRSFAESLFLRVVTNFLRVAVPGVG